MTQRQLPALVLALATAAAAAGCKRGEATQSAEPTTAANEAAAAANEAKESAAPSALTAERRFEGTFEAQPGSMYIPREGDVPNAIEWAGTKFRSDDAGVGRGTGTLALHVASDGAVTGDGAGSLGAFTFVGQRLGDRIVGTVRGAGPEGFLGTLDLRVSGNAASGEGRLSDGEARVVRTLTITLTRK